MRWTVSEYLELPELLIVLWRLTRGDHVASGELWRHPLGYELRILAGDELMRSQVHPNRHEAESDGAETRERLIGHGFTRCEP